MERPFEKAVCLNNAGAQRLAKEDFVGAIKALSIAFHCFEKAYKRSSSHLSREGRQEHCISNFNMDEWMVKITSSNEDDTEIYQHPIQIPYNMITDADTSGLVSTAITFNLALANHLNGLRTENKSWLSTASRLYEYGFSLERIRGNSFVSPFFLMAVLNNLGHIHMANREIDRSQKCFRQLLSTLIYLTQIKGFNPKDLEMFYGNTTISSRCAAAA